MTIKEIAKLANVSTGTVDRVIHNRGSVNKEKKARIEKIIADNQFKPNAFASNLKLNRNLVIGYVTPLLKSEGGYWGLVYEGAKKAENELVDNSISLKVFEYDRNRVGSFSIQGERMINAGISDCILIAKCEEEAKTFLLEHPDLNYVFIDSIVPGTEPITLVGQNANMGGRLAAKIMNLLLPMRSSYLTFSFKSSLISRERIKGFAEYLARDNLHQLFIEKIDNVNELGDMLRHNFLSEHIDGIFVPCFAGSLVAEELKKIGIKEWPKIITYDLIDCNRKALEAGEIDCILSQRPVFQGYAGVYQLYKHLVLRQDVESYLEASVDVLFTENLPAGFDEKIPGHVNQYCINER